MYELNISKRQGYCNNWENMSIPALLEISTFFVIELNKLGGCYETKIKRN